MIIPMSRKLWPSVMNDFYAANFATPKSTKNTPQYSIRATARRFFNSLLKESIFVEMNSLTSAR